MRKAHTMTELLVASVLIVILFTATLGAFVLAKNVYVDSIANYNLQRDVNNVLLRMIRGEPESGGRYGLRSAVSFEIPSSSRLDFKSTDYSQTEYVRSYYLNNNTIVYSSPTNNPVQQVIYAPPPNSTVTLNFASISMDQQVIYVYIAVSRQIGNKTAVGSIATNINFRNAPK